MPGKKVRKGSIDSCSSYLTVTGETDNHGKPQDHETDHPSSNIRKRKPVHYRRSVPDKQEGEIEANGNENNENSEENVYSTIDAKHVNSTYTRLTQDKRKDGIDKIYLRSASVTEDGQTEKRKDKIRRWSVDKEKKHRLLSTSSTASLQENSDELSGMDEDFIQGKNYNKEEENQPVEKEKSWKQIKLILLFSISLGIIVFLGGFFIFKSEERLTKLLELQEAQIETLKSHVTSMKDQIMHFEKEHEKLKRK